MKFLGKSSSPLYMQPYKAEFRVLCFNLLLKCAYLQSDLSSFTEAELSELIPLPMPPAGHGVDKKLATEASHECMMATDVLQLAK